MSKPIGKENDGALKYVFKLPKEGKFIAKFYDGNSISIDVNINDTSSNKFAFIGKKHGRIYQTWTSKPSKEEALKVLKRVKYYGNK